MTKFSNYFIFLILSFAISGCATIVNGSRQTVSIHSNPPGATVTVNDSVYGKTPLSLNMKRKKEKRIVKLSLDQYETYEITMYRNLDGWIFGNFLFGGLIGVI